MGNAFAVLALLLFSANVFAVRLASTRMRQDIGFLIALGANVLFGAILFGAQLLIRADRFQFDARGVVTFALAGICASYLGRRGFFASVETLGPSRASAIQITNPIFAALFAWATLGERLEGLEILLIAVALTGLCLTSLRQHAEAPIPLSGRSRRPASRVLRVRVPVKLLLPALFAAAAYGAGNVLRAAAMDTWPEPVFGGFLGALAGTTAYVLFHVSPRTVVSRIRAAERSAAALWMLTGLLTISAQVSVIAATAYTPVAVVLVISSALPIVVIPVSLLVLRDVEGISGVTVLGSLLVLLGVAGMILR